MDADLAAPLTPPDCDLRGMPYMPLDIVRLFDSDFYALSTGDEFKAGLTLWGKAFLQVPAGSLPDEDRILAHLSGAGSNWKRVREVALRGWVKCSDGRLYHRTVAEKAAEAWQLRLDRRARTQAARAARGQSATGPPTGPATNGSAEPVTHQTTISVTEKGTASVTETVTGSKGSTREVQGNGTEERRKEATPSARDDLFSIGLPILMGLSGLPRGKAASLVGKFAKDAGDDCAAVLSAIREAEETRPIEPVSWLTEAVKARTGRRQSTLDRIDKDWNLGRLEDLDANAERLQRENDETQGKLIQ